MENEFTKVELKPEPQKTEKTPSNSLKFWSLAWEMGFIIAVPIIMLALLGRLLDKTFLTSPLFLLVGILLAMIVTGILIWKKIKNTIE